MSYFLCLAVHRVCSENEKSFGIFSHFDCSLKMQKLSLFSQKNRKILRKKQHFIEHLSKKIKYSYSTCGFLEQNLRKKFSPNFSQFLFTKFCFVFAFFVPFIFLNAEFRGKVCKIRTKIFAFFRETFRPLQTLVRK